MGHPEFEELRKKRERGRWCFPVSRSLASAVLEKLLWVNEDIN